MSFGGGSTKEMPAPEQKPLGVDESRASTNEQARPIPYMAGLTRVGVTWLDDAFETRADAVVSSSGKGQTSVRGYNYYASLVALICHGPVDAIEAIYFNGDKVWTGPIVRGADEDHVDINIESHGYMRLYWGTVTQEEEPPDGDYKLTDSGHFHPAYKRQCYAMFNEIYFGFNQTNAPNIEMVIARYPKYDWLTDGSKVEDDCNPVAVVAEWLQNKIFGLGWPEAWLDTEALNTVAARLAEEKIGLSPVVTKQTGARQLITQICEYIDGYVRITEEGKLQLGLIRKPEDVEALPLIDENLLLSEPELNPQSWQGVKTKTWIKFTDRSREYQENSLPYRDAGAALLALDNSPQTIERPWVTRSELAKAMVAATGRALALPETGGDLEVRKSVTLKPGDLFRLSYAQLGIENMVMRVVSRSLGKPGERSIGLSVTLDRSYLNEKYYIPPDDELTEPDTVEPEPFTRQLMLEAPIGLEEEDKITVLPLVSRENRLTTLFNVYLRRTSDFYSSTIPRMNSLGVSGNIVGDYDYPDTIDETVGIVFHYSASYLNETIVQMANLGRLALWAGNEYMTVLKWNQIDDNNARCHVIRHRLNVYYRPGFFSTVIPNGTFAMLMYSQQPMFTVTYDELDTHSSFAITGKVSEEYPRETFHMDKWKGMLVEITSQDHTLVSPMLANAMLNKLLVFAGDEILSVIKAVLQPSKKYRLYCIRARYDTSRLAHPLNEEVFIVESSKLKRLTHGSFLAGTRSNFKLQPYALGKLAELADIEPIGLTLKGRRTAPLAPANLRAFNDGQNPVYQAGDDILLSWTLRENSARGFWERWKTPIATSVGTRLAFHRLSGVFVFHADVPVDEADYTLSDTGDFDADGGFMVRAYGLKNGLLSKNYDELTIKLI